MVLAARLRSGRGSRFHPRACTVWIMAVSDPRAAEGSRQFKPEAAPVALLRVAANAAPQQLHDTLANGEAKACAAGFAGGAAAELLERLEQQIHL